MLVVEDNCAAAKTQIWEAVVGGGRPYAIFFSSNAVSTRCCISALILIMLFRLRRNISYGEARRLSSHCATMPLVLTVLARLC
jgi:hypothetical protein